MKGAGQYLIVERDLAFHPHQQGYVDLGQGLPIPVVAVLVVGIVRPVGGDAADVEAQVLRILGPSQPALEEGQDLVPAYRLQQFGDPRACQGAFLVGAAMGFHPSFRQICPLGGTGCEEPCKSQQLGSGVRVEPFQQGPPQPKLIRHRLKQEGRTDAERRGDGGRHVGAGVLVLLLCLELLPSLVVDDLAGTGILLADADHAGSGSLLFGVPIGRRHVCIIGTVWMVLEYDA